MAYAILKKTCENGCALYYSRDKCTYVDAAYKAGRLRGKTYVITVEQMKDIFFPKQDNKDINDYLRANTRGFEDGFAVIYLPLPSDFKKHIK